MLSQLPITLIIECAVGLIVFVILLNLFRGSIVYIPNNQYGIIERKWALPFVGKNERHGLISLGAGAGYLPDVRRGGWHFFMPYQYRVVKRPLIRIDQVAYLVARIGAPLLEGQALAAWPEGITVEDGRGFLEKGGQRGLQRHIERAGTCAINTALFCVFTAGSILNIEGEGGTEDDKQLHSLLSARKGFQPIVIGDDNIGIVTVQDGPALQHGEIIAPTVGADPDKPETFHNSFQDIGRFLSAGGRRGRQEQVLVEGTYYINRLFATVEFKEKLKIGIGTVGVVNSYVGADLADALTAEEGRGRTVDRGQRGIWSRSLGPGKYANNPYAMEVTIVPTTNFQLRWEEDVTSSAIGGSNSVSYDGDLKEIPVITKDAFDILLPISIVAHISPANAPHVIQRFSAVQRLVNQTLDPFISSYFRDAAQGRTLLDFIQQRDEIGKQAIAAMSARLAEHKIDIEEVMLGTPRAAPGDDKVEKLLDQLRQRQVASEQTETYKSQRLAADEQTRLNESLAVAGQQAALTASKIAITVAENEGAAQTAKSVRAAEGIKAMADAEAYAQEVKSKAIGGQDFLLAQLAVTTLGKAIAESKYKLVPDVVVMSGGEDGKSTTIIDALVAMALPNGLKSIGPKT